MGGGAAGARRGMKMMLLAFGRGTLAAAAASAGVGAGSAACEQRASEEANEAEEKGRTRGAPGGASGDDEAPVSNRHTARWRIFTDRARSIAAGASRQGGADEGKLREALGLMKAALDEAIQGFGEDDPHVAAAMSNLAEVNRVMGRAEAAEELYVAAIRRLEGVYGSAEALDAGEAPGARGGGGDGDRERGGGEREDPKAGTLHPSVGAALHNLGGFYLYTHDGRKAEAALRRALRAKLYSVGRAHPEYARTLFFLSEALRIQHGPCDAAVAALQEGIDIMAKLGAGNTDASLRQMVRLVELLCQCGRCAEAEALVHRATAVIRGASFPTQVQSGAMDRMLRAIGETCGSSHYQRRGTGASDE